MEGRLPAQLVAMAEQLRKSAVPTTRVGAVQGLQGMMVEAFKEVFVWKRKGVMKLWHVESWWTMSTNTRMLHLHRAPG